MSAEGFTTTDGAAVTFPFTSNDPGLTDYTVDLSIDTAGTCLEDAEGETLVCVVETIGGHGVDQSTMPGHLGYLVNMPGATAIATSGTFAASNGSTQQVFTSGGTNPGDRIIKWQMPLSALIAGITYSTLAFGASSAGSTETIQSHTFEIDASAVSGCTDCPALPIGAERSSSRAAVRVAGNGFSLSVLVAKYSDEQARELGFGDAQLLREYVAFVDNQ